MSDKHKNLSVLAYSNGFTLWHYSTACTLDEVLGEDYFNERGDLLRIGEGYFNELGDMLRTGDMIMCNTGTDGDAQACIVLVSSVTGSNVSVTKI